MTDDVVANLRSARIEDVLGTLWELSGFEGQPDVAFVPSMIALINHSDALIRERVAFVLWKYKRIEGVQEQMVSWAERENDQTILGLLANNLVFTMREVPEFADRARRRLALLALDSRRDPDLRLVCLNSILGAASENYAKFDHHSDEAALVKFTSTLTKIIGS